MNYKDKQKGSVIIFTVLILGSMMSITLALAAIYIPKLGLARDAGASSIGAIYAADSALEWCLYTNRDKPALAAPVMANGATYALTFNSNPSVCATTEVPMNHRATATFRGVSRSLEVTTVNPNP